MTKTGENELIKPFIFLGLLFGWLNWLYVKSARKIAKKYQLITASNQIFSCSLDYSSNCECSNQSWVNRPESAARNLAFPLFISNIVSCVWKRVPDRFSGSGISLIWSSGVRVRMPNEPRDYGFERNFGSGSRDRKNPIGDPHGTRAGQMGPFRSCPLGFFHVVPARKRSRFSHTRN